MQKVHHLVYGKFDTCNVGFARIHMADRFESFLEFSQGSE